MSEELQRIQRKSTWYFIVRYPTGITAEVLGKGGHWLSPFNSETVLWRTNNFHGAQLKAERNGGKAISLFELEKLCDTLNKLAKMKAGES